MGLTNILAAFIAVSSLFIQSLALNPYAKSNLAVYWGQGAGQNRLSYFCEKTSFDIIVVGFINVFPDQGPAGWPGSNFGNQCADSYYYTKNGTKTKLLDGCYQIKEDLPKCKALGKTILLSLGGGAVHDFYEVKSEESALNFADFLWGAFGPLTPDWTGPRPFGEASVDGFDFDIEKGSNFGYSIMVRRLRELFLQDPLNRYYISAAPQCIMPDKYLSHAISNSAFDFIFIQFYNNPSCSAKRWVTNPKSVTYTVDDWVKYIRKSGNPLAKLFIGLPASKSAAAKEDYLTPGEATKIVSTYMAKYPSTFGGMMVWEATASENNKLGGLPYADIMKEVLLRCDPDPPTSTVTSTISASTSTQTSSQSTTMETKTLSASTTPSSPSTVSPSSTMQTTSTGSTSTGTGTTSSQVTSSTTISTRSASTETVTTRSQEPPSTTISTRPASTETVTTRSQEPPSSTISTRSASTETVTTRSQEPPSSTISTRSASTETSTSSQDSPSTTISTKSAPTGTVTTRSQDLPSTTISTRSPETETETVTTKSQDSPSITLSTRSSSAETVSTRSQHSSSTTISTKSAPTETGTTSEHSTSMPVSTRSASTETVITRSQNSDSQSMTVSTRSPSTESITTRSQGSPSETFSTKSVPVDTISTELPSQTHSTTDSTPVSSSPTIPSGSTTIIPGTASDPVSAPTTTVPPNPTLTLAPSSSTTEDRTTITTIITTSYVTVCPTGFTTVTITYTTTYCPETASLTPTQAPIPGAPAPPPDGWTTIVTVCPQCAPTPTTVTLTVPTRSAFLPAPTETRPVVTVVPVPENPIKNVKPSESGDFVTVTTVAPATVTKTLEYNNPVDSDVNVQPTGGSSPVEFEGGAMTVRSMDVVAKALITAGAAVLGLFLGL
uniref:Endochitinase 2 n=1 Tax=Coccidioides immitis (strain RS) TaxID=246410 RepID=CHI2_COCIM|nr:RecName: Full=Endochitinase 2; Flags: Precursor [Coccidioides immitis RS]